MVKRFFIKTTPVNHISAFKRSTCVEFRLVWRVFVFPGPRSWPPICIYQPWASFVFTALAYDLHHRSEDWISIYLIIGSSSSGSSNSSSCNFFEINNTNSCMPILVNQGNWSVQAHRLLSRFSHSHKKRKDSLEGTLDRVLLAAELEFSKIASTQATSAYIKCEP